MLGAVDAGAAVAVERHAEGTALGVLAQAEEEFAPGGAVEGTARNDGRTVTTAYQPATGLPATVTQTSPPADPDDPSTAQTNVIALDPLRALPVRTTDTNGHQTVLRHDALGRASHVWLPDRDPDDTPTYQFDYRFVEGSPVAVRTRTIGVDGEQDSSYVLYDGLLRERQTQDPGPDGGRLLTDTLYNALGLPHRTHAPYHGSGAPTNQLYLPDVPQIETQTRLSYDALGRETRRQLVAGNGDGGEILGTTETHYFGDRTTVIPPEGDTATTTIQDVRGRTTELRQHHERTLGAAFDATTYAYTPFDLLARVTDPAGNEWVYEYDQLGRRTQAHDPDAGTTVSVHDDRDQITSTTDARGATLAYAYDNLGRRTELSDGAGETLATWEYDTVPGAQGQLAAATRHEDGEPYTTRVLEYDALYRALRTEVTIPASEGALAGSYETATSYAASGLPEAYTYPAAGNLSSLTVTPRYEDGTRRQVGLDGSQGLYTRTNYSLTGKPLQFEMKLDPDAYEAAWVTNTYEWGTQRLKTSWTMRFLAGGPDRYETYSYDEAGNVTSINDVSLTGSETQCFRYDHLRRLTEAWAQTEEECAADPADATLGGPAPYWHSYAYDLSGNRLTETFHERDTTRTYAYPEAGGPQPHTLTSVVEETPEVRSLEQYAYDAAGNTVARQTGGDTQELAWNAEGRLTEVTEADGTRTEYLYDAEGNRLIGRTPTETTLYLGHTEVVLPAGASTARATRYVDAGGGHLVVLEDNGDISYTLADHLGTARVAVDAWTLEASQRRVLPFGEIRGADADSWPGTRGYVGGTTDTSTGLTHLGAREYDPATGRFLSLDPVMDLTDPQQIHGYTYANNNPLTFADPTGLFFKDIIRGIKSGVRKITNATRQTVGSAGRTWSNRASQAARDYRCGFSCSSQDARGYQPQCDDACRAAALYRCGWACTDEMPVPRQPPVWMQALGQFLYSAIPLVDLPACIADSDVGACLDTGTDLAGSLKAALIAVRAVVPDTTRCSGDGALCNSFVPGTRVLMADGTSRPIEEVRIGDEVVATDPETGETSARTVTAEIATTETKYLTRLVVDTEDGRAVLVATDDHPVWNETTRSWTEAADLPPGAELTAPDGTLTRVAASTRHTRGTAVHNLTVEGPHTYYVLAGETPVLAHNSGSDCDVSIYKAPSRGTTQRLLEDGFDPADFPGSGNGYPDGRAYFGLQDEGREIALDYASRGGYDSAVVRVRIPEADFDRYFSSYVGSHNGVPGVEVAIPNTQFEVLNRYPRELIE
ncbi:hypothetical protein EBN88_03490 [Streptomyces triticirhizae]|uniref:Hint domain-containing protein n=1 Tax=Streptomyces triticirhizae TaxID=2483353 RepID=A0A3M2M8N9_9ACTN|nr:hypothetical protein EBN88_03490 [Streptomyces triticirhizae]